MQVAYAIGVAHPVSVMVETFGTERVGRGTHPRACSTSTSTCGPGAFREYLDLHRPIYQKTAAYGHFGREDHDFTWEKTDKADALRDAAGLEQAAGRLALAGLGRRRGRRRAREALLRQALGLCLATASCRACVDRLRPASRLGDAAEGEVGVVGAGGVEVDRPDAQDAVDQRPGRC